MYAECVPAGSMMSAQICSIKRAANGFEVEVRDPEIEEANRKPKSQWRDPYRCYVFETKEGVAAFVTKVLDKLGPLQEDEETEYASQFDALAKKAEK